MPGPDPTHPPTARPVPAGGPSVAPGAPAHDAAPALVAEGLTQRFGDRTALRGVDLRADRGEVVAVLGPNGAGKTTLLSALAGMRPPDEGSVDRRPDEVGWVPQQTAVYRRLTVRENLELFARLEGVPDVDVVVERMLEQTGLADRAGDRLGSLSGGNQQRVNIAIGLLADPPVLLLDEPSSSLDPRQRERMWEFLGALTGEGTAIVVSTHDVAEADRHADRVLVLADGEVLFDGPPAALAAETGAAEGADFSGAFVTFLGERGH